MRLRAAFLNACRGIGLCKNCTLSLQDLSHVLLSRKVLQEKSSWLNSRIGAIFLVVNPDFVVRIIGPDGDVELRGDRRRR